MLILGNRFLNFYPTKLFILCTCVSINFIMFIVWRAGSIIEICQIEHFDWFLSSQLTCLRHVTKPCITLVLAEIAANISQGDIFKILLYNKNIFRNIFKSIFCVAITGFLRRKTCMRNWFFLKFSQTLRWIVILFSLQGL